VGKKPAELTAAEAREAVLCSINRRRRAHGRRALRANPSLLDAAQAHSTEMDGANYFSHTSPNGDTIFDRIKRTGYLSRGGAWGVGESLRWGTGGLGTPRAAVNSWMASPAHRATLLSARFRDAGIGIAFGSPFRGEDAGAIYTADFGYH
jgi:uncharacterized protein YkwD